MNTKRLWPYSVALILILILAVWLSWPQPVMRPYAGALSALCQFDGPTTVPGHAVQLSTTVPGACHDAGVASPTSGGRVLGIVAERATNPIPPGTVWVIMGGGTGCQPPECRWTQK